VAGQLKRRTATTNSRLNTAHTQQHGTKRSISPVSRRSSSTAARGRPRGQHGVIGSASTSVRPGSDHARRQQSRRRRRRGAALVATNDCDSGVAYVAQSRRSCLVSSASKVQLHFTATTVDCSRQATSRMIAGSGHASSSHGFYELDASTRIFVRRLFLSTDTFKLRPNRAVFVNTTIKLAACACRSVRPSRTQRCRKQREAISGSSAYTGVAAGAMSPKRTEITET